MNWAFIAESLLVMAEAKTSFEQSAKKERMVLGISVLSLNF